MGEMRLTASLMWLVASWSSGWNYLMNMNNPCSVSLVLRGFSYVSPSPSELIVVWVGENIWYCTSCSAKAMLAHTKALIDYNDAFGPVSFCMFAAVSMVLKKTLASQFISQIRFSLWRSLMMPFLRQNMSLTVCVIFLTCVKCWQLGPLKNFISAW